ncbi:MAG: hypothetical protein IT378_14350 [Sandaracinaceae bacterium]|nr:hypothetical protein [Sandaracinaceae bacterium]MCC6875485.1 hypothetical protein [Sandaracinaceae bacterium]
MPIPDLDADGLLPQGLHDCTLDELDARFGRFGGSDMRPRLAAALRAYLEELKDAEVADHVVVDGSFVTAKDEPGDVDLIVALRPDLDLTQDLRPFEYNVVSKRRVKKRYPFDLLLAPDRSEAYEKHLAFFFQVKGRPELRKGLLKVMP